MKEEKQAEDRPRKKRRLVRTFLIILGILVVIRLIMPFVILHYANQKLARLDGYYGHIDDIDLALFRGAYVINDVYIKKVDKDTKDTTDFFSCSNIDLSVQWKAIFEKKIVGEVEFDKPVIKYVMHKVIGKGSDKDSTNFIQLVKDFMPLRINRFAVDKGQVHYIDQTKSPGVDVPMTNLDIEGKNLTNRPDSGQVLPASIVATSNLYDGTMKVNVKLDPLNPQPTFDLNGILSQTNLVHLNNFFKAYGNFDVEHGTMALYTEVAARDGKFDGYVKPLIKDLDVVRFDKEEGSPLQIAWEAFVGTTAQVLTNQPKDQLGTKVELHGEFKKPNVDVLSAILSLLRNAFIEALKPSIDNSVSISTVGTQPEDKKKGIIERLFGKKDKDEKKKGK